MAKADLTMEVRFDVRDLTLRLELARLALETLHCIENRYQTVSKLQRIKEIANEIGESVENDS